MKPKFANFKFIAQNANTENIYVNSEFVALCTFYQSAVQCLILQHALAFNVNLIAALRRDYCYRRKNRLHTNMTLQTAHKRGELYRLQAEIQLEP